MKTILHTFSNLDIKTPWSKMLNYKKYSLIFNIAIGLRLMEKY